MVDDSCCSHGCTSEFMRCAVHFLVCRLDRLPLPGFSYQTAVRVNLDTVPILWACPGRRPSCFGAAGWGQSDDWPRDVGLAMLMMSVSPVPVHVPWIVGPSSEDAVVELGAAGPARAGET